MSSRSAVSEPSMERLPLRGFDRPRRRWVRLILPFLALAAAIALWRADSGTWTQVRSAVFGAVSPGDEDRQPPERRPTAEREFSFAGKGEIDVDGGLVTIYPLAVGEVEDVAVKENDRVEAGAVLLRIRNRTAALLIQEAEQGVRLAKIDVEKASRAPEDLQKQVQLADLAVQAEERLVAVAQRNVEQLRTLSQQVSAESVRTANDALVVAQQRLDARRLERDRLLLRRPQEDVQAAQAALARAESKLAAAREEAERYVVRARAAGRVMRVNVTSGETLTAALREPAVLLLPDRPWIVRCEVEQEFAPRVAKGMVVEIRDDATGEKVADGVVDRVSGVFAPRRQPVEDIRLHNDYRTVQCVVALKSSPERLRIGQHIRALFRPAATSNRPS